MTGTNLLYIPFGGGSGVFGFKTGLGNNESVNSCVKVSSFSILGAAPPPNDMEQYQIWV